jgi:TRAP-type C4-dicarboxylate transport system permease small subunit
MAEPDKPLDPQDAAVIARVRRLMLIASLTTVIAFGAVIAVIGYRVFHAQGSAPLPAPANLAATVPSGAKVLSTAIGDGRIVLTLEVAGAIELMTFDAQTLRPLGHLRLSSGP